MKKNIEIHQRIREERIRQGISIRTLGDIVGCSWRAIAYWEAGERMISVDMADRVLSALGIGIWLGTPGKEK